MTWVFGYGSLVWRPAFPYAARQVATIHGWSRRWWQGSPDHRGVPASPGRVVTLVPEPGATCTGMAYQLPPDEEAQILAALDVREIAGYDRHRTALRLTGGDETDGLMWVANARNDSFLGPAPVEEMAQHILTSVGPSGTNLEYLQRLAHALRDLGALDRHTAALDLAVRRLLV